MNSNTPIHCIPLYTKLHFAVLYQMACSEAKRKTMFFLFIYKADPEHIILNYTTLYHYHTCFCISNNCKIVKYSFDLTLIYHGLR